jgi:hypothetical protein
VIADWREDDELFEYLELAECRRDR